MSAFRRAVVAAAVLGTLVLAAAASGHIERASYWPDPAADNSVSPPAGGQVPTMSVGTGYPPNEAELVQCLAAVTTGDFDPNTCPWFVTPPKPSG